MRIILATIILAVSASLVAAEPPKPRVISPPPPDQADSKMVQAARSANESRVGHEAKVVITQATLKHVAPGASPNTGTAGRQKGSPAPKLTVVALTKDNGDAELEAVLATSQHVKVIQRNQPAPPPEKQ